MALYHAVCPIPIEWKCVSIQISDWNRDTTSARTSVRKLYDSTKWRKYFDGRHPRYHDVTSRRLYTNRREHFSIHYSVNRHTVQRFWLSFSNGDRFPSQFEHVSDRTDFELVPQNIPNAIPPLRIGWVVPSRVLTDSMDAVWPASLYSRVVQHWASDTFRHWLHFRRYAMPCVVNTTQFYFPNTVKWCVLSNCYT